MFVAVIVCLGVLALGVFMLMFPDSYRSWRKFGNEWEGVRTEQGSTFELQRVITGGACIAIGALGLIVVAIAAL